jgi:hypothetical protein
MIERGLFESADGQWRITNPWRLNIELRHRWLVAEHSADRAGACTTATTRRCMTLAPTSKHATTLAGR